MIRRNAPGARLNNSLHQPQDQASRNAEPTSSNLKAAKVVTIIGGMPISKYTYKGQSQVCMELFSIRGPILGISFEILTRKKAPNAKKRLSGLSR